MGKAGKWIRNFLLGKKEEKYKKINAVCTESRNAVMDSPKVKRRWSFGKLTGGRTTGKVVAGQKYSMSFDSVDTAKLEIQTLLKTRAPRSLPTAPEEASDETKNSAATKIQAAFRSYLARRALHALKGLVKLQALVRGHLVRKQTTATLRGMHALMAIQVRARIHRIQMVEEATLLGKQPIQHTEIPHGKGRRREDKDSKDMSVEEMLKALEKRSGSLDRSHVKSLKHDSMTFYSKRTSVSERQHAYHDYNLITAPNSPENYGALSEFNPTAMALSTSQHHSMSRRQPWSPNYMNDTESSKAKARSQSEPKQRPKRGVRHKGKSEESTKELITSQNGPRQNLYSNSSCFDHGSLDHWVINFYGSMKEGRRNSFGSSTVTSDSYH